MLWAPSCLQLLEAGEDVLAYSPTRQPRDQRVSQDQIFWELPALWEGFWVWSGTTGKTETTAGHKKRGAMEVPGCYSNFQVGSALGSKFLPRGPFGDVDLQHWLLLQGCIAVARGSMLSYNNKAALST